MTLFNHFCSILHSRNDVSRTLLTRVSSDSPLFVDTFERSSSWEAFERVYKKLKLDISQPTMLCRAHTGPARAARTGPVLIWPRALQWPRMGLPHECHNFQTVYSNCSFFKIIKKVSLFACFNF